MPLARKGFVLPNRELLLTITRNANGENSLSHKPITNRGLGIRSECERKRIRCAALDEMPVAQARRLVLIKGARREVGCVLANISCRTGAIP